FAGFWLPPLQAEMMVAKHVFGQQVLVGERRCGGRQMDGLEAVECGPDGVGEHERVFGLVALENPLQVNALVAVDQRGPALYREAVERLEDLAGGLGLLDPGAVSRLTRDLLGLVAGYDRGEAEFATLGRGDLPRHASLEVARGHADRAGSGYV